jgi:hypothetical protein
VNRDRRDDGRVQREVEKGGSDTYVTYIPRRDVVEEQKRVRPSSTAQYDGRDRDYERRSREREYNREHYSNHDMERNSPKRGRSPPPPPPPPRLSTSFDEAPASFDAKHADVDVRAERFTTTGSRDYRFVSLVAHNAYKRNTSLVVHSAYKRSALSLSLFSISFSFFLLIADVARDVWFSEPLLEILTVDHTRVKMNAS